jgi:DNA-binding MarR family transcriptional regulator
MTQNQPPPETEPLVDQVTRLVRIMHAWKVASINASPERAANALLFPLSLGPKRSSELAEAVHSDPSTISRHIASLVERGLVERIPDPADRRAAVLAITDQGQSLLVELKQKRCEKAAEALSDWTPRAMTDTAERLRALNDSLEAYTQGISPMNEQQRDEQ